MGVLSTDWFVLVVGAPGSKLVSNLCSISWWRRRPGVGPRPRWGRGRGWLVKDPDVRATIDTELAARIRQWGPLSAERTATEIDYWVDRFDPAAVRRTGYAAQGVRVDVHDPDDGSGTVIIAGRLIVTDGDALDQRLDAMARAVSDQDPRTLEQRRGAALGALGQGADKLAELAARPSIHLCADDL